MANANLYFKFVSDSTKAGVNGLTVTANVYKLTKSGTKTTVATGASCAEVGGGIYSYNLSSPDFATYDYIATATPSSTTGLANADADSMWADFSPDVQSRVPAALTTDGNIKADALRLGGTAQTGRDIGASVLLSSGTGTGQISLSSGAVTAGTVSDKTGYAISSSGLASVTAWTVAITGNITGNLSGSVGSVTSRVAANTDQWNGATVTGMPMPTYTQPTGFLAATFPTTVASTTNITAGTITTVTNLTNAPTNGDLTATMKTSISGLTIARVTLADTITTYTGNTPQTGDTYARIGANGAGLTSLAPASTALSTAVWTPTKAGFIDAAISTITTGGLTTADITAALLSKVFIAGDYPSNSLGFYILRTDTRSGQIKSATDRIQVIEPLVTRTHAATVDSLDVSGNTITLADGTTQEVSSDGRVTTLPE